MMDELSYCIRQPCKWRHSSEKKKKNRKTNVVAQKQQARVEGATAHHGSMQRQAVSPPSPDHPRPTSDSLSSEKKAGLHTLCSR